MCPIVDSLPLLLFTRYQNFYAKMSIILDTISKNSTTQWTIVAIIEGKSEFPYQNLTFAHAFEANRYVLSLLIVVC
jgi:hypothetical protein